MAKNPGSLLSRYGPANPLGRLLCSTLLILLLIAGVIALSLYLVYRPSKPRFTILSAAVYELANGATSSATPANTITTSMQFTIAIRNPSERASVHYDRLSSYVAYRGEAITPTTPITEVFQEQDSTVTVSPVLGGGCFPVSAEAVVGLKADEAYGVVGLRLVVLGRLRYKSGPFRSGWYGMYVRCDMLLGLKKGVTGQVPLIGAPNCGIDV